MSESPLDRKPLREEISEVLHRQIISGKIAPGEWLRQEEIAAQLGVSQTPVREALDSLVSSGLAERIPYRGVRVIELSQDEIVDAYLLRLILETNAVILAASVRTEEQLQRLDEIITKTSTLFTLNDMSMQMQLNREFHQAVVNSAGSALLARLYEMVSHQFPDWLLYEYMFRHPELLFETLSEELGEHQAILDAIRQKDEESARQAVLNHLHHLGNELVEYLDVPEQTIRERERFFLSSAHLI